MYSDTVVVLTGSNKVLQPRLQRLMKGSMAQGNSDGYCQQLEISEDERFLPPNEGTLEDEKW